MKSKVITIIRKNFPCLVAPTLVADLDKSKCSHRFLSHNFPDTAIVYVKCDINGEFEMRGKKQEYRIIKEDENI